MHPIIKINNEDNMKLMARYEDKYFDLAIIDPPYGILNKTKRGGDKKFNMEEYSKWDIKPDNKFFDELIRVSKNQIIWGGNYFEYIWTKNRYNRCFIVWDKVQPETLNNFSMAELAWTSFDKPSKIFKFSVRRNRNKIHPTQKPVELYDWILRLFAKKGDKILDTHMGSGTIAIACYLQKFDLTACEIDTHYYNLALNKIRSVVPDQHLELNSLLSDEEIVGWRSKKPKEEIIKPKQELLILEK